VGELTTYYLVDANNHTGYAQVLEEKQDTSGDGILQDTEVTKTYVIGQDVIAQAAQAAAMFFMYDGHGSTRALLDKVGHIVRNAAASNQKQLFSYDAYGNLTIAPQLVRDVAQALTSLLYSGEQTDSSGLQYLRARYYDPRNGIFTSFDSYSGNIKDPQTLHRYLYALANPISVLDPSGHFPLLTFLGLGTFGLLGLAAGLGILGLFLAWSYGTNSGSYYRGLYNFWDGSRWYSEAHKNGASAIATFMTTNSAKLAARYPGADLNALQQLYTQLYLRDVSRYCDISMEYLISDMQEVLPNIAGISDSITFVPAVINQLEPHEPDNILVLVPKGYDLKRITDLEDDPDIIFFYVGSSPFVPIEHLNNWKGWGDAKRVAFLTNQAF
jgi:RHS repeat-associated protein